MTTPVKIECPFSLVGKVVREVKQEDLSPEALEELRQAWAVPLAAQCAGVHADVLVRIRHNTDFYFVGTIEIAGATENIDTRQVSG